VGSSWTNAAQGSEQDKDLGNGGSKGLSGQQAPRTKIAEIPFEVYAQVCLRNSPMELLKTRMQDNN